MRDTDTRPTGSGDDCTTTGSFVDDGIDDGHRLVQRTYYRLRAADERFEPTEGFFDRLAVAFRWAYMETADGNEVPDHVEAALDDARVFTAERFADADPGGLDLRTEVVPAFYREVAGFHCAYREW